MSMSSDTHEQNQVLNTTHFASNDTRSNEYQEAQNSLELTQQAIAEEHVICSRHHRFKQQKQHMINNYLYQNTLPPDITQPTPTRNGEAYTFHHSKS